jgi:hypothetical protein
MRLLAVVRQTVDVHVMSVAPPVEIANICGTLIGGGDA